MPAKKTAAAKAEPATGAAPDASNDNQSSDNGTTTPTVADGSAATPASAVSVSGPGSVDGSAPVADGSTEAPAAPAPGPGPVPDAAPADPPAAVVTTTPEPPAETSAEVSPTAAFVQFLAEKATPAEIPAAVPVVAPVVVDAIAAVPDDHRADYQQLIRSLVAVNHGLDNATHALRVLRALRRTDSGRELLVARQFNAPEIEARLTLLLSLPPAAAATEL